MIWRSRDCERTNIVCGREKTRYISCDARTASQPGKHVTNSAPSTRRRSCPAINTLKPQPSARFKIKQIVSSPAQASSAIRQARRHRAHVLQCDQLSNITRYAESLDGSSVYEATIVPVCKLFPFSFRNRELPRTTIHTDQDSWENPNSGNVETFHSRKVDIHLSRKVTLMV